MVFGSAHFRTIPKNHFKGLAENLLMNKVRDTMPMNEIDERMRTTQTDFVVCHGNEYVQKSTAGDQKVRLRGSQICRRSYLNLTGEEDFQKAIGLICFKRFNLQWSIMEHSK